MRARHGILFILVLAAACGIKPELPSQIPSTQVLGDNSYQITYRWLVDGVSDMLVHRGGFTLFYVIQDEDSLSIYPTYRNEDQVPLVNRRLFEGLDSPRLLADGNDLKLRLWVFDAGDGLLKGYDGEVFQDTISPELSYADPAWREVLAIAADDEGHVFVADRQLNKIFRYEVTGTAQSPELEPDGELIWTSQAGGATVRDIAYVEGRIVLLDDGLMTLQVLDPLSGPQSPPVFAYFDELFSEPSAVTGDAEHIFVVDPAALQVWELPMDLSADELLVNTHSKEILAAPTAITVVDGRVYVADSTLGKIIDYEKRQ